MNDAVITLNGLEKRFLGMDKPAVAPLDCTIHAGYVTGLVGPDGAGKTTLMRMLAGLLKPDSGSATVIGFDPIKNDGALHAVLGYMPQKFGLYEDLTVMENLNLYADLRSVTGEARKQTFARLLEFTSLGPFTGRLAGKLSGGMKQKLALCCALIHNPEVLFLDEPTTGVDPVSRKEFWQMLHRLQERGITIVVSTPFMDEARQCDRIAFLQHGHIQGIDTPTIILERFKDILCPPGLEHDTSHQEAQTVIRVEQLVKTFGNFTAVDHISFEVKRGEIFGFLGANGAGKTTAMRILCGLSRPTSGKAEVMGYDVRTQSEDIKKHIGYMSQKFSLYEDLKVWENVRLFAGIYGVPESEIAPRTEEMLKRIGLHDERETLVRELPLGWKQRLAFSVSIFHNPQLVFLDEPTGGVDPATRRQFWQLIYQAADRGITIFVTTHYMDEAEYCDRISMMVDGQIKALDSPEGLKARFHAANMDEVFHQLARNATRSSD